MLCSTLLLLLHVFEGFMAKLEKHFCLRMLNSTNPKMSHRRFFLRNCYSIRIIQKTYVSQNGDMLMYNIYNQHFQLGIILF